MNDLVLERLPETENLVMLKDICKPILGISWQVARRYHALGKLSVKTFRLGDSRRGPLFVHRDDVTELIEKRRSPKR